MLQIDGVTEDKLEKYGAEVIQVLQKYSTWRLPGETARSKLLPPLLFCYHADVVSLAEEQTDGGGDGWIDTRAGRTRGDEGEESTYFHGEAAQGRKRKKAPFFKYSKRRKGYGNASSTSKGSVVSHFESSTLGG